MKGKINLNGYLKIERAGTMRSQICPQVMRRGLLRPNPSYEDLPCGDWCPLFSEPERLNPRDEGWEILICKTSLYFTEFQDERVE